MSRIGLKPVNLPAGVEVKIDGNVVSVKGPKGELKQQVSDKLTINVEDGQLNVEGPGVTVDDRAQHGLARSLLANMVTGVSEGFAKKLEVEGVGYRVEKKGKTLVLNLGFSHPIELDDPEGIETETPSANVIIVKGIDKEKVGTYAAKIREWREPEPYKGKGIRYEDEYVRRKEGKAGVKAE